MGSPASSSLPESRASAAAGRVCESSWSCPGDPVRGWSAKTLDSQEGESFLKIKGYILTVGSCQPIGQSPVTLGTLPGGLCHPFLGVPPVFKSTQPASCQPCPDCWQEPQEGDVGASNPFAPPETHVLLG